MLNNLNQTHDYFRRRLHGLFVITDYTRADLARAMCVPYNTVLQSARPFRHYRLHPR